MGAPLRREHQHAVKSRFELSCFAGMCVVVQMITTDVQVMITI